MKYKVLSLLAAMQLVSFGSVAHADVIFRLADPDTCASLPGTTWTGDGTVSAAGGVLNCKYSGTATVSGTASNFNMDIALKKEGGSFLCPATEKLNLPGTCNNGQLSLITSEANLHGSFLDSAGTHAQISGTVNIGKVVANAAIDMHKS